MKPEACLFRSNVQLEPQGETARCELLRQQFGPLPMLSGRVSRQTCLACLAHTSDLFANHPVFPSLVFQQCELALLDADQTAVDDLVALRDRAERALLEQLESAPTATHTPSCDVVLCAHEPSFTLQQSIESILAQVDAVPILHLVDTSSGGQTFAAYQGRWNVLIHHQPTQTSPLAAVHAIIEHFRTPFIALQAPYARSLPRRLSQAINGLLTTGSELCAAQGGTIRSQAPQTAYQHWVSPETLVLRRATLIDMGGAAHRLDDDIEFVSRAHHEGRPFVILEEQAVNLLEPTQLSTPGPAPRYSSLEVGTLRCFARGLPAVPAACDVVLPFHGHLDYVEQALEGLLSQEQAELVIHLIDDTSPLNTDQFLRRWSQHPRIRTYRNRENIGQFQSLNNIVPFLETDLIAVQDADDISLPHRIQTAAQMLHYSAADYFAAAVELFGDDHVIAPVVHETATLTRIPRAQFRCSHYAPPETARYFAENPTAVFRKSMFEALGGYADFGNRLANRTSLDTEFQVRCLFSGVRFAFSREIVARYRVHAESATQDRQSGWGSAARTDSFRQLNARYQTFQAGQFDPRSFGSLGRFQHITERFN